MSEPVVFEEDERRAVVRLNRPEKANAIDFATAAELHRVCQRLESAPKILVVTGSGGMFSSGADLTELGERRRDDALAGTHSGIFQRIRHLPMPTIAAVGGPAVGGGAELAYACDFRVATPRARFGQPEAAIGLLAAAGATWRLRELVGEALANEMVLAGRVLTAEEALSVRLVNELVEEDRLMEATELLVDRARQGAPVAVRLAKLALRMPPEAHPWFDDVAQAVLFGTDDAAQRVAAFLDRRARRGQAPR